MNMIDEQILVEALRQEATSFRLSEGAAERIIEAARTSLDDSTSRIRPPSRFVSGRSALIGLAAAAVVLAVSIPLLRAENSSNRAAVFGPIHRVAGGTEKTAVGGTGFVARTWAPNLGIQNTAAVIQTDAAGRVHTSSSSLRVEEVGSVKLSLGAKQFAVALSRLSAFAVGDGGFVASSKSHIGTKATRTVSSGSIVLQVPQHNFHRLLSQVHSVGLETSVVTTTTDVSGQYVDLQARITALDVSRRQYLAIMGRTNSISGILAVQSQLDSLQSQIEQLQGELLLLNGQTTYATLSVTLVQSGETSVAPTHTRSGFDKAWHDSITGFVAGFEWLIRLAGPVLFVALLLAALFGLGRISWRSLDRRRH